MPFGPPIPIIIDISGLSYRILRDGINVVLSPNEKTIVSTTSTNVIIQTGNINGNALIAQMNTDSSFNLIVNDISFNYSSVTNSGNLTVTPYNLWPSYGWVMDVYQLFGQEVANPRIYISTFDISSIYSDSSLNTQPSMTNNIPFKELTDAINYNIFFYTSPPYAATFSYVLCPRNTTIITNIPFNTNIPPSNIAIPNSTTQKYSIGNMYNYWNDNFIEAYLHRSNTLTGLTLPGNPPSPGNTTDFSITGNGRFGFKFTVPFPANNPNQPVAFGIPPNVVLYNLNGYFDSINQQMVITCLPITNPNISIKCLIQLTQIFTNTSRPTRGITGHPNAWTITNSNVPFTIILNAEYYSKFGSYSNEFALYIANPPNNSDGPENRINTPPYNFPSGTYIYVFDIYLNGNLIAQRPFGNGNPYTPYDYPGISSVHIQVP